MDPKARLIAQSPYEVTATLVGTTDLLQPGSEAANASQVVVTSEVLALDAGGSARVVNAPSAIGMRGATVHIVNTGGEALHVTDGSATLVTIDTAETGTVKCIDDSWYNVGLAKAT